MTCGLYNAGSITRIATRKEGTMPHYKNGREVKVGDKMVGKNQWNGVFTGIVTTIFPGAQTCNINYVPTGTPTQTATTTDCLHEDDVEIEAKVCSLDTYDAGNVNNPKVDV
jgi:hypothetical protein